MATARITVRLERETIEELDRLARECAKLDPEEERRFAEEGMAFSPAGAEQSQEITGC